MKQISLTQGKFAQVDDEDYDYLNQWKWCANKKPNENYYAVRRASILQGETKEIRMHRIIMKTPDGMECDHINHNGIDNQKSNLRNCTHGQNMKNRTSAKNASSKYLGVYWYKVNKKWRATISINGKVTHLGTFKTEIEAAKAYNIMAEKHYGEFANLNFK